MTTHFQGDLLSTRSNVIAWDAFKTSIQVTNQEESELRRAIDAELIKKLNTRDGYLIERKLPPLLALRYFEILDFNRYYTARLSSVTKTLNIYVSHNTWGHFILTVPLKSGFKNGFWFTKLHKAPNTGTNSKIKEDVY